MLSQELIISLLDILNVSNKQHHEVTFNQILERISKVIPKTQVPRLLLVLKIFLDDGYVDHEADVIALYYTLFHYSQKTTSSNPETSIFSSQLPHLSSSSSSSPLPSVPYSPSSSNPALRSQSILPPTPTTLSVLFEKLFIRSKDMKRQQLFILKLLQGAIDSNSKPYQYYVQLNSVPQERIDQELASCSKTSLQILMELEKITQIEHEQSLGGLKSNGISPILFLNNNDSESVMDKRPGISELCENVDYKEGGIFLRFEPSFFKRPKPPELPIEMESDDELACDEHMWINEEVISNIDVLYDVSGLSEDENDHLNYRNNSKSDDNYEIATFEGLTFDELFVSAFQKQLYPAQQQFVLQTMNQKSQSILLTTNSQLTPNRLPDLVKNNPSIAAQTLLTLMSTSYITEYLSVLVSIPINHQLTEVVSQLVTKSGKDNLLLKNFLYMYISNAIERCEQTGKQDKGMQQRLVKLLCVFCQNLIHNQYLTITHPSPQANDNNTSTSSTSLSSAEDDREILVELKRFCLLFAKVSEANKLYTLIEKHLR